MEKFLSLALSNLTGECFLNCRYIMWQGMCVRNVNFTPMNLLTPIIITITTFYNIRNTVKHSVMVTVV